MIQCCYLLELTDFFCGDIPRKKENMEPADPRYLGHVFSATGEAQLSKDWPTLVIQQLPLNALLPIFSLSPHFQPTLSFPLTALWQAPVSKSFNLFNICTRVTLIVGLPPRLTSVWIISSQIFLQISSSFVSNSPFPPSLAGRLEQLITPWFALCS